MNRAGVADRTVEEGSGDGVGVALPGDVGLRALSGVSASPEAWALLAEDCEARARAAGAGPGRAAWEALVLDTMRRVSSGQRVGALQGMEGEASAGAFFDALAGAAHWRQAAEATGEYEAWELYDSALHHAWRCRAYLLRREAA
ncbi:hypothetical protein [Myxococcus sp. Y35]|uniref:hypothetical protein n=1 Tax=Pseudomyxococcus flavus TaxID=3115648 RepID=UPI003CEDC3D6